MYLKFQTRLILIICTYLITISCQKINIPQSKVVEKLTKYGKRHKENLILISTNFGNIKVKLYDETPLHRADFIRLTKLKVFNSRKIYRVIEGFCVQGGLYPDDSVKYDLPGELTPSKTHKVGAFSMGALNPQMTSATEFFIVPKFNEKQAKSIKSLDGKYTVFGEVIEGQEVVDKIALEKFAEWDAKNSTVKFSISLIKK